MQLTASSTLCTYEGGQHHHVATQQQEQQRRRDRRTVHQNQEILSEYNFQVSTHRGNISTPTLIFHVHLSIFTNPKIDCVNPYTTAGSVFTIGILGEDCN